MQQRRYGSACQQAMLSPLISTHIQKCEEVLCEAPNVRLHLLPEAGARAERRRGAVRGKPVIGRVSCFQCYCPPLAGSCQGKQEHAPADYEHASRSTRCFLTYS